MTVRDALAAGEHGTARAAMLERLFVHASDLEQLLQHWAGSMAVFAPALRQGAVHYEPAASALAAICLDGARPIEPIKSFMTPARERIARYGGPSSESTVVPRPTVIVGIRACDLRAVEALDKVLLSGKFTDPFYAARRQATALVSVDCLAPTATCFCVALGHRPYAGSASDIDLSPLDDGYVMEVRTETGRGLLREYGGRLGQASPDQAGRVAEARARATGLVLRQNEGFPQGEKAAAVVRASASSPEWERLARRCVECAACEMVCPTCHCFMLSDQRVGEAFERTRAWASCHLAGFARMAGGGTPRPRLSERFRNRLVHKFDFFPANYGMYGCTGCGRCIEACLAGLDIRKVLMDAGAALEAA